MLKWIKAGALAVMLALPWAMPVGAVSTVVTNTTDQLLNAVDETTSTLTATPFEILTVFVSGTYSTGNTVWLQQEVGSPGSGAFENVAQLDTSTANARSSLTWTNGPNTNGYRLKMTAFGTGAVVAYLTNHNPTPRNFRDGTYLDTQIVFFDDLIAGYDDAADFTAINDEVYIPIGGTDNSGVIALHDVSNREGGIVHTVSTDEDDVECLGVNVVADHASLVSDGWTVFETRYQVDVLTAGHGMGLTDQLCHTTNTSWTVIGTTVAAPVANSDTAGFFTNDAATETTGVMAVSSIDAVEGANAIAVNAGTSTAAVYHTYRIEVDSLGNAYWFYNGVFVHAEPLAVLTTAEIAPLVFVESSSAGSTAMVQTIDYWYYVKPRPTAAST